MKINQNNIDDHKEIINGLMPLKHSDVFENVNYLYPNVHRITHQIKWFKGSRDRGFKPDSVA